MKLRDYVTGVLIVAAVLACFAFYTYVFVVGYLK